MKIGLHLLGGPFGLIYKSVTVASDAIAKLTGQVRNLDAVTRGVQDALAKMDKNTGPNVWVWDAVGNANKKLEAEGATMARNTEQLGQIGQEYVWLIEGIGNAIGNAQYWGENESSGRGESQAQRLQKMLGALSTFADQFGAEWKRAGDMQRAYLNLAGTDADIQLQAIRDKYATVIQYMRQHGNEAQVIALEAQRALEMFAVTNGEQVNMQMMTMQERMEGLTAAAQSFGEALGEASSVSQRMQDDAEAQLGALKALEGGMERMQGTAQSFGESMANAAMTGSSATQSMRDAFGSMFGDLAEGFIQLAVAQIAGMTNPFVGLAAGIALRAASGMIKAAITGPKGGGGGGAASAIAGQAIARRRDSDEDNQGGGNTYVYNMYGHSEPDEIQGSTHTTSQRGARRGLPSVRRGRSKRTGRVAAS